MVLMKGEAITAGSNPIFSAKMGREAPTSLAQATDVYKRQLQNAVTDTAGSVESVDVGGVSMKGST